MHVIFDPTSQGFIADVMMTFALNELAKIEPFSGLIKRKKVVIVNPEIVEDKIREEVAKQIGNGTDPKFAKSYTMVLRNLADETAHI